MLYIIFLLIPFLSFAEVQVPTGLAPIPWPEDNPYSEKKAELGRYLFFDKRLSGDGTVSCATCHDPSKGWTDQLPVSTGIGGNKGTRNAQTCINSAYWKQLFWDGRAPSLEEQCKGPLANPVEMALSDDPHVAYKNCHQRLFSIKGYRAMFKEAFGSEDFTIDQVAQAIATYERTILSGNSKFDQYIMGDKTALNEEQIQGMKLFNRKNCATCHFGLTFSDNKFNNIGVGMDKPNPDLGRYNITHDPKDWGAFRTPGLRDVFDSPPYMHDGSIKTLEEVIDYYDRGGNKNKNLHPAMIPLHLKPEEKKALLSFLEALNGEGWQHVVPPEKFPE